MEKGRKPQAIDLGDTIKPDKNTNNGGTKSSAKARPARKPRIIETASKGKSVELVLVPDEAANGLLETPPALTAGKARGFSWMALIAGSLAALISLAAAIAFDQFLRNLFARNDWLGWVALGLTGLLALGILGLVVREARALFRNGEINRLRDAVQKARDGGGIDKARRVARLVRSLYGGRNDLMRPLERLSGHDSDIIDPEDLIDLTERELMAPLDAAAQKMIMDAAKRVSIVTAVSPRALIDIAYVLIENLRLIKRISGHYGGRPGTIGLTRLSGRVVGHLAVTGTIAAGESLLQQFIGHGLAAKLSARLGEGIVNGLLTARVGISAMDLCRPMPFQALARPGISGYFYELLRFNKTEDKDVSNG